MLRRSGLPGLWKDFGLCELINPFYSLRGEGGEDGYSI